MAIFDDVISGNGEATFGSSTPSYALWQVTAIGPYVQIFDPTNTDKLAKVGWFSFFHNGFDFGSEIRFYDEPIWFNMQSGRWHVTPALILGGSNLGMYAEGVRWALSLDCEVHLLIGP